MGDRDLVEAVLRDYRTAPLSPKDRSLFALVDTVNTDAAKVTQDDVDAALAAGWSQEAVYDAISVCSLFKFYNTWVDGIGARGMSNPMYAQAGMRLAERGYAPDNGE
ncbi:MAG: peroxidase [Phycisphaerae bacterium]